MKVYNSAGYAEKRLKFATLSYDGSESLISLFFIYSKQQLKYLSMPLKEDENDHRQENVMRCRNNISGLETDVEVQLG